MTPENVKKFRPAFLALFLFVAYLSWPSRGEIEKAKTKADLYVQHVAKCLDSISLEEYATASEKRTVKKATNVLCGLAWDTYSTMTFLERSFVPDGALGALAIAGKEPLVYNGEEIVEILRDYTNLYPKLSQRRDPRRPLKVA